MNLTVESPEAVGFSSQRLARITPVMQMTQYMVGFDIPEKDFQVLAYQALIS